MIDHPLRHLHKGNIQHNNFDFSSESWSEVWYASFLNFSKHISAVQHTFYPPKMCRLASKEPETSQVDPNLLPNRNVIEEHQWYIHFTRNGYIIEQHQWCIHLTVRALSGTDKPHYHNEEAYYHTYHPKTLLSHSGPLPLPISHWSIMVSTYSRGIRVWVVGP